uniref:TIGR04104 family putative zinc finger protein n=1 Tax=Chryseomicrobium sp. FSL W7-1435 TaxID=2921704 RepID=UPI00406C3D1E
MPVCQNCNYTWSLGETLKRSFTLSPAMKCPNCNTNQFMTVKSRKRSAFLSFIVIFLITGFNIRYGPTAYTFLFFIVTLGILTITYPRFIKLSSTEEHMF